MPDIRSLGEVSENGKLIYQLVSASSLKDTDLFAISSTDNLTRKVSLNQIKLSMTSNFYNKQYIDDLFDKLREQIKTTGDKIEELQNNITEFRNEFNNQLNLMVNDYNTKFNNIDKKITDLNTTLSQKITDLDVKLTKMITEWISYGTAIPTTLETGRVYLQYF